MEIIQIHPDKTRVKFRFFTGEHQSPAPLARQQLEALKLYRGQPPLLHALWRQEGLTQKALAAELHISPATLTKMLQRMEKAGFI